MLWPAAICGKYHINIYINVVMVTQKDNHHSYEKSYMGHYSIIRMIDIDFCETTGRIINNDFSFVVIFNISYK